MADLNREVVVYVNGDTPEVLYWWTRKFEQFFGGATTVHARGTWEGKGEGVNLVSHLYDVFEMDFKAYELDQLVRKYKREANQDAALVVYREARGILI